VSGQSKALATDGIDFDRRAILAAVLHTIVPMQPELVREPFHRDGWVYEEKYDGWRMLAFKDGPRVRLVSRQGVDHTERFRELAAAVAALKAPTLILDGEVCVFDKDLVSQFHLLDRSVSDEPCTPPVLMAFDCLHVHGLPENGLAAWAVVKERGYEGLVAKDQESPYRAGLTRSWLKVKVRREGRFVLGGILGLPHTFAGILVAERIGRRLVYRGTVEWGLGLRTAKELLRRGTERGSSPFHDFSLSRGVTWLEPTRTVEVTYSEIMDGQIRDPVYRGLA